MKTLIATVMALAVALPVFAGNLNSGLDKGERVTPFHPEHIAGPLANSTKCFPCTYGARPAVQVWVNGDDPANVAKIAKALHENVASHKGHEFQAMIVVLTSDKAGAKAKFAEAAKIAGKDVAIALLDPSSEAVQAYKINTEASVRNTVLVYKDLKVMDKFVNLQMDDKGCGALCGSIAGLVK